LTPAGAGAIAVIAMRGAQAWSIARRLFRPALGKPLPERPVAGSTWFGRIGDGAGDEVILAVPTDEPLVEIQCHGGQQVVRWLVDQCCREGCAEVSTFLDADDPWSLLQHAKTLRTGAILLDQANGALARTIVDIREAVASGDDARAERQLRELSRYIPVGQHLVEPWRVVIAGAPNAGKSSLLNALAGYQRSIVAAIPGTTRDVVTATLVFDGWPVELSDTAGLRDSGDALEAEGVDRAHAQIAAADLCLWVIDATGPAPSSIAHFAAATGIGPAWVLPVVNKIDQPPAWDLAGFRGAAAVSATEGTGLNELIHRMVALLVPHAPPAGAGVPYSAATVELVETSLQLLEEGGRDAVVNRLQTFSSTAPTRLFTDVAQSSK
jgi:tRNA modification GTPase